jgi:hypothetical protein
VQATGLTALAEDETRMVYLATALCEVVVRSSMDATDLEWCSEGVTAGETEGDDVRRVRLQCEW